MPSQACKPAAHGARRSLGAALLVLALRSGPGSAGPLPVPVALPAREQLPLTLETRLSLNGPELLVLDLDGDGEPELVTCGTNPDTLARAFVLASRIEGCVSHPIKQWNFVAGQGGLAGTADLLPDDGREELLLWRLEGAQLYLWADGMRPGPDGERIETLWRSEAVPLPPAAPRGEARLRMHGSGRLDAAADLWVALPVAGFALAPRGPLLFAADGRLRRHAAAAPNAYCTGIADLDGDGRPELFLATHATCNGQQLPGEDDCHSYWRVLDGDGRRLLDIEAGGPFSEAQTRPLRAAGQATRIAALRFGGEEDGLLRVYGADAALLRERRLAAALWRCLVLDWDGDGSDELLLGLADGRLLLLDRELEVRGDWSFTAAVGPLAAVDLRRRGRPDLLLAVGNQLALFDQELRPLALWDGELRYSHQLKQVAVGWVDAQGRGLVGLSRGLPAASVLLELVPAATPAAGRRAGQRLLLLAAAGGLAGGFALAYGLRALRRRRAALRAAPPTAEHWHALRDQLRAFGHSETARRQLQRLTALLRNSRGDSAAQYLPRLRAEAAAFRAQTWPLLQQIGALADGGPWDATRSRAFRASGERLAALAAALAAEAPPTAAALAAAEEAARAIGAALGSLSRQVDAQLAVSPERFLGLLLGRLAGGGLPLRLELGGDWQGTAPIADPDAAEQLIDALGRFYRERLRHQPGGLSVRAWQDHDQLLVACRDELVPAPTAADLEGSGAAALAAQLQCGLRCHEGEIQLAFAVAAVAAVAAAAARARAATADS
jgi:hypothetical protein